MINRDRPLQLSSQYAPFVAQRDNTYVAPPVHPDFIPMSQPDVDDATFALNSSALGTLGFVEAAEAKQPDAKAIIRSLATDTYFKAGRIRYSMRKALETQLHTILKDPQQRAALIDYFQLGSTQNISDLVSATGLEAGYRDPKEVFPVGAVMLNRALANNLLQAARQVQGKGEAALTEFKPLTIRDMIMEQEQFAISKSRFRHNSELHRKTPELSNNAVNFPPNNQVVSDLLAGQIQFEDWNGQDINAGDLYFFHKASFPEVKLKTPNGHRFATHAYRNKAFYPIFSSFTRKFINYNV